MPPISPEILKQVKGIELRSRALERLLRTAIAATFFIGAPAVLAPKEARPPILVAILFPAIGFGLVELIQYSRRLGTRSDPRPR